MARISDMTGDAGQPLTGLGAPNAIGTGTPLVHVLGPHVKTTGTRAYNTSTVPDTLSLFRGDWTPATPNYGGRIGLVVVSTNYNPRALVALHLSGDGLNGYVARYALYDGQIRLYKIVAGVWAQVESWNLSAFSAPGVGGVNEMGAFIVNGTSGGNPSVTISVSWNGQAGAYTWTDTTDPFLDAQLGPLGGYYGGGDFPNLAVEGVQIDYFDSDEFTGTGGEDPTPAPTVAITRPTAAVLPLPAGTELVLRATATAAGGGDLSAGITWTSSNAADGNAGALGTGASLNLDTNGWAAGARQILAARTDTNGTGADSFTLDIDGGASATSPSTPELRTMCDLYHRDPDATRRLVPLYLTLADGTPAPAAAAKAKIIKNGGAAADSNANVAAIAGAPAGWFAVQLTAAEQDTPGSLAVAYDDGTARGRTLCAVLPLAAPVAGSVTAAASVTAVTLPAGLRIRSGWVLSITQGTGEGGSAVVDSYNAATGATVLEDPGLPAQPDATSRFAATAAPAGSTMPLTDANGRVEVAGAINRLDALPAPNNNGIATLLARIPAEVATDADVQAIANTLSTGVPLAPGVAATIANTLLDLPDGVETGYALRQVLRLLAAILGGAVEGAGTISEKFKALNGAKVRATVAADPQGNRTIILDLT